MHPLLTFAAAAQGVYYLVTGVWPLVSIDTFEMVTGPKVDDWLVRTVGVVVAVSGAVLLVAAVRQRFTLEVFVLAVGDALALGAIDVVYVSAGRISPVYLVDAVAQAVLIGCWTAGAWLDRRRAGSARSRGV